MLNVRHKEQIMIFSGVGVMESICKAEVNAQRKGREYYKQKEAIRS